MSVFSIYSHVFVCHCLMTVMFIELFYIVSDKNNKSKESEASKAYVSDSESDSEEHEVVSIYSTITTVNNLFDITCISVWFCWIDFALKTNVN